MKKCIVFFYQIKVIGDSEGSIGGCKENAGFDHTYSNMPCARECEVGKIGKAKTIRSENLFLIRKLITHIKRPEIFIFNETILASIGLFNQKKSLPQKLRLKTRYSATLDQKMSISVL